MNVLVIAPHPDDEILGCGGTLLRHRRDGDDVHVVLVTAMREDRGFDRARVESRAGEIERVREGLGADVHQLRHPTATLTDGDVVTLIPLLERLFRSIAPDVVYLPNRGDAHSDHRVCFDAAHACTKVFRCPSIRSVLMYETVSETDFAPALPGSAFLPNYFVDISGLLARKVELMKCYASELGEHPFPRSVPALEALATLRGAAAGVEHAEAFQLIKHIR